MASRVTGGKKLQALLANAGKGSIKRVEVGFYKSARYPRSYTGRGGGSRSPRRNPPTAAMVAAWMEWGTMRNGALAVPPRPFMRPAAVELRKEMLRILKEHVDPKTMVVTPQIGGLIGLAGQTAIRDAIDAVRQPPLKPATVARKGSSKPLIDTGFLRRSATWEVVK